MLELDNFFSDALVTSPGFIANKSNTQVHMNEANSLKPNKVGSSDDLLHKVVKCVHVLSASTY